MIPFVLEPAGRPAPSPTGYDRVAPEDESPYLTGAVVRDARRFSDPTEHSQILSDVRHRGGKTYRIDFTEDLGIAVCFACQVDKNRKEEDGRIHGRLKVKYVGTIVLVCLALSLAACGGSHLSVDLAGGGETLRLEFPPRQAVERQLPRISGGIPPYESSIEGCPDWVTLLPDQGVLAGMAPAEDGGKTYFCTYRVTESDPGFRPQRSVTYGLRIIVGPRDTLSLLPSPGKQSLLVGTFLDEEFPEASGGVAPYTYAFTCTGGSLPPGVGFAPATRRLAGTPTARFHDSCTYSVTDSAQPAATVSRAVEVEVSGVALTLDDDVPDAVNLRVGTFGSEAFPGVASGGVPPYAYAFTCAGGSLPSGMGFAPETRIFAGTPDAPFRDSCTYTVTDSSQPAATVSRAVEVEVSGVALTLDDDVPDAVNLRVGTFFDRELPEASGGIEPYTYSFTCAGGSLPSGMGFAPETRRFAGTPDASFRDSCTYTVTDSAQPAATVSRAVEVEVSGVALTLDDDVPDAVNLRVGTFGSEAFPGVASGGVPPYAYAFTCAGGSLPSGMGFAPETRIFAGTPDAPFRDSCTYTVTDSSQPAATVSRAVEVEVSGVALTLDDDVPDAVNLRVGTFFDRELPEASGGIEPYTYSFTCAGGSLPSGMGFAPETRRFAGTPDASFRDSCTYTVTDSAQPAATVSRAVEVEVSGVALTLDDDVPDAVNLRVGTFGSEAFPGVASGGVPPYAYAFTCAGGSLPSGMGFAPETRIFAGTPDAPFRDSCTYTVTDSSQPAATVSRAVEVEVSGVALTLDDDVPDAVNLRVGTFFDRELPEASGGIEPYTYSFTCAGGSLPSGMGFAPETRRFAGTPDASFRDSCTYTVTDSAQPAATVSRAVEVEVSGVALTLDDDVPDAVNLRVGTFGSEAFPGVASGGVPPYAYAFTCAGGSLPSGMGFAPETRIFAGTPDAPFRDSCTYTVTDSSQPAATVSRAVEVEVSGVALTLDDDVPDAVNLRVGTFFDRELPEASGGIEPYTYSFTCAGGSLPSGMGFAPETRRFAGTPDASFRDSCTYTVTDSAQPAATVSRAIVVATQSLALPSVSDQPFVIGTFRSVTLPAATGGVGPYTYTLTCAGGGLPPGLGFAPATRELGGVTDAVFRDECEYTVTDSAQPAATASQDIVVTSVAHGSLDLPDEPEKIRFVIGTFRSITLPAATGGVGPYTYTFDCDGSLPSGVGFAPATRVLAGVANAAFPKTTCTYTVTDSAQPAVTVSRDIEVTVESLVLPDTHEKVRFVVGGFRSLTFPAATGGVAPYTYTFTCDGGSPSEVEFDPMTRRLEVADVPDAGFRDTCTYTVTDSAPSPATVSRRIEVTVESLVLRDTPEKIHFVVGDFRSFTLPAATGGVEPYTYTFTCGGGLPSGVGFAPRTRRLAGVADAGSVSRSCTYTVEDSAPSPARVSRRIEVTVGLDLSTEPRNRVRFVIGDFGSFTLPAATGGVEPYTYTFTCAGGRLPPGVGFAPATRVLSGVANAVFDDTCTYTVKDRSQPAERVSRNIEVVVEPLERGRWRFLTRTLEDSDHPVDRDAEGPQPFVVLPHALPETGSAEEDCVIYRLPGIKEPHVPSSSHLRFNQESRELSYRHPGTDPVFETPTTHRYEVRTYPKPPSPAMCADHEEEPDLYKVQDALCVDVSYRDPPPHEDDPNDGLLSTVQVSVRDDASWDETRRAYRCPDAPPMQASSSGAGVSNPVHMALGPVHARRAAGVAHAAVRDRVRDWSPESPGAPHGFAITPSVEFASLSGLSDGFDYSGTSESASFGAETGAGVWQAGLVASFTHTELDYQAEAALAERGYRTGEHDTEILSLHPFAAWHAPSGGHVWASLGAGGGSLSHRDDLGFRSWSRSDVRLFAYAVGASVPVADMLSGELQAEAGIESFALDIEGGGRISSSLPTLKGRDWHAGLAWGAPVAGAPSLSLAWRRSTGDGPEGSRLETRGSVSADGVLDPRLSLTGTAAASFGLGDYEHDSWGLGGGVRFAPGGSGRGFGLDVDARLRSSDHERPAGVGVRGEAGYGLWGGPFFGTVRPYVGLIRHSGDGALRRALGVDLRDTPDSRIKVEVYEEPRDRLRALVFTLRHLF